MIKSMKDVGRELDTHRHAIHWVVTDMRNGFITDRKRARRRLKGMKKTIESALEILED